MARPSFVSRRAQRSLARLAVITALSIGASAGWTLTQPAPASAAGCVVISAVRFDATGDDSKNLNGEWVKVTNRCDRLIGVGGWRVKDRAGNKYTFASTVRMGKGSIYLHTGRGSNRPGHRYWGRTSQVWNNAGTETAYLINKAGTTVSKVTRVMRMTTPTPPPPSTGVWSTPFGTRPCWCGLEPIRPTCR